MRTIKRPKISVVIVTHNRVNTLRLTLLSLAKNQNPAPDEVVIIDDASKNPILKDVEDCMSMLRARNIEVKIYRTSRELGLGSCRALGTKLSSGDVIVFLDDDVIVLPNIFREYISMFDKGCDIVAGLALPLYLGLKRWALPKWWDETILGGLLAIRNDIAYAKHRNVADFVYGCNFAIRRSVLHLVKNFKPWLGRVSGTLLSGEEWDLVIRAAMKNAKICFAPKAAVLHLVPITKISLRRVYNMAKGIGVTRCLLAYEGSLNQSLLKYLLTRIIGIIIHIVMSLTTTTQPKKLYHVYCVLTNLFSLLLCRETILSKTRSGINKE